MKKLIVIGIFLSVTNSITAQTWDEWFRQKVTQKKYLLQQIAAFQVYEGYLTKGYTIAKNGLNSIQNIKKGDFNLHSDYFTSLVTVNPKIKKCSRVVDIFNLQVSIITQAAKTIKDCRNTHQLTNVEIDYLQKVFNTLLDDCWICLDKLYNLITDGQLNMKDDERLKAIENIYNEMADKQVFARSFSNSAFGLCVQRNADQRDIIISKKLNGLK